jgi:probable HAF family extracellular repeat protein
MKSTIAFMLALCFGLAMLNPKPAIAEQHSGDKSTNYLVFSLGTLGGSSGAGNSINQAGWVAGISNLADNTTAHATLWIYGRAFDLGTLGGPNSGVEWPVHNNRGQIAGIAETDTIDPLGESWSCSAFFPTVTGLVCRGFIWENGHMQKLPTLGGDNGYAAGMNNRGQAVGWGENTVHDTTCNPPQVLQFEAVIYGPGQGQIQQLPPYTGDPDSAATAINDQGQVVGISGTCSNAVGGFSAAHALMWNNGVATNLGSLGGIAWNTPASINSRGQIVGFSDLPGDDDGSPNFHAFLWTKQTGIQDLGTLPGDTLSEALGINDAGQVVGTSCTAGFASCRAFLWENGNMVDLNMRIASGSLSLVFANDINDAGEISGGGFDAATNDTPAFIALPAPGLGPSNRTASSLAKLPESARQRLVRLGPFGRIGR